MVEGASIAGGTYVLNWTGSATATVGVFSVQKGVPFTIGAGSDTAVQFNGGTFSLPQLEPASVATPFERRPIGVEQMLCERYFQIIERVVLVRQPSLNAFYGGITPFFFATKMRASPTLMNANFVQGTYNDPAFYLSERGGTVNFASGSTVGDYAIYNLTFQAEL